MSAVSDSLGVISKLNLTLSGTYPYAYRIGLRVMAARADWDQAWSEEQSELAELKLNQARGYAFLRWAERSLNHDELSDAVKRAFESASDAEIQELKNTADWYLERAAARSDEIKITN